MEGGGGGGGSDNRDNHMEFLLLTAVLHSTQFL